MLSGSKRFRYAEIEKKYSTEERAIFEPITDASNEGKREDMRALLAHLTAAQKARLKDYTKDLLRVDVEAEQAELDAEKAKLQAEIVIIQSHKKQVLHQCAAQLAQKLPAYTTPAPAPSSSKPAPKISI